MLSNINVGCGYDITIKELAEVIGKAVGYHGEITFDPCKPDGPPRMLMDSSRLNALGGQAEVTLQEGLAKAYQDFLTLARPSSANIDCAAITMAYHSPPKSHHKSPPQVASLHKAIQAEMNREAIQSALGLPDRKSFRERYLKPALAEGLIEMTLPDKPNSRLQKCRLTDKGHQCLLQEQACSR